MIETYEAGSLAETQESVCLDIASRILQTMEEMPSSDLLRHHITQKAGPHPMRPTEYDVTIHYWLAPFTPHVEQTEPGVSLMTRVHTYDGMYCDFTELHIVKVPLDEEGKAKFPDASADWEVAYTVNTYAGVFVGDKLRANAKADEDDLTMCRILLEDALTTFAETKDA